MRILGIMIGLGLVAGCSGMTTTDSNMDDGNVSSRNFRTDSGNFGTPNSSENGGSTVIRTDADFENARPLAPGEKFSTSQGAVRTTGGSAVTSVVDWGGLVNAFSELEGEVEFVISEDQEGARIITSESVIQVDEALMERSLFQGLIEEATDIDGTKTYILNNDEDTEYDYMIVAGWGRADMSNELQPNTPITFGVSGNPTTAETMPTGAATYRGESMGLASSAAGSGITTSDIEITTPDYNDITVRSSNTRIAVDGVNSAADLDYTATGTVSGNGFSADGDGVNVTGDFFGPGAAEAGGTFSGTRTYRGEAATYGGAFGAKKAN